MATTDSRGNAAQVCSTQAAQTLHERIVSTLRDRNRAIGLCTIAMAVEAPQHQVEGALDDLVRAGRLEKRGHAKYGLTDAEQPTGDEVAAATATVHEATDVAAAIDSVTVEPVAIDDSGSGALPLLVPNEVANTCGTCVAWDDGCSVCEVVGDELTANSPACSDWAPAPTAEQVREGTALGLQFLDDMREVVLGAEKRAASGEPTIDDLVGQLEEDRRELDSQAQHLVNAIDAERESLTRATEAYRGELERIRSDLSRVEARLRDLDAMRGRVVRGQEAAE